MAGGIHPDTADDLLDSYFGSGTPATLYYGLFTAMPDADGTGATEATGGGYARESATNNATNFPAASAGVQKNGAAVTWSAFSADLGEILGVGVFEAESGGEPTFWALFSSPRTVLNGQGLEIPVNGISFTMRSAA